MCWEPHVFSKRNNEWILLQIKTRQPFLELAVCINDSCDVDSLLLTSSGHLIVPMGGSFLTEFARTPCHDQS